MYFIVKLRSRSCEGMLRVRKVSLLNISNLNCILLHGIYRFQKGFHRYEIYNFSNQKMTEEFRKHLGELLKSSDFSDVTLVSDDHKIFKGHKNILSGFSPILMNLFKIDSQYHQTLLHLNGINSTEISVLMEFIYFNTFPKTWSEQLQSAVISLQIKGLQEHINEKGTADDMRGEYFEAEEAEDLDFKPTNTEVSESYFNYMPITKKNLYKVKLSDLVKIEDQDSLDKSQEKTKELFNHSMTDLDKNTKVSSSNESNKKTEIIEYKCELCHFITTKNSRLKEHINQKHLAIKEDTPCDECDYNPKDKRNLAKHNKCA